mmetsp:Transcript_28316/g.84778  ORF Transcript_28316/g.84778 Transcript_28316/m.84778 type:complete len:484 (-) Transcript_28316:173-1624(-)
MARQRGGLRQRLVEDADAPVLGAGGEAGPGGVRAEGRGVPGRRREGLDARGRERPETLRRRHGHEVRAERAEAAGLALDGHLGGVGRAREADFVVEAGAAEAGAEAAHGRDLAAVRRAHRGPGDGAGDLGPLQTGGAEDGAVVAAAHDRAVGEHRHGRHGRLGRLDDPRDGEAVGCIQVLDVPGQRHGQGLVADPQRGHLHVGDVAADRQRRLEGVRALGERPEAQGLVGRRRQELGAVGGEGARVHGALRVLLGVGRLQLPELLALLALVQDDLLVRAHGAEDGAVRAVAHAVDVVRVVRQRVVQFEGRPLVEDALEVLGARDDAEGPRLAVGHGNHLLLVADHLPDAVARVPHDALREHALAVAHDHDPLGFAVPLDVLHGAGEDLHLHLEQMLGVVPRPDAQEARLVAGRHPVAVGREGRGAHGVLVAAVHEVVAGVVERPHDHVLAEGVHEFFFLRVRVDVERVAALHGRAGHQPALEG